MCRMVGFWVAVFGGFLGGTPGRPPGAPIATNHPASGSPRGSPSGSFNGPPGDPRGGPPGSRAIPGHRPRARQIPARSPTEPRRIRNKRQALDGCPTDRTKQRPRLPAPMNAFGSLGLGFVGVCKKLTWGFWGAVPGGFPGGTPGRPPGASIATNPQSSAWLWRRLAAPRPASTHKTISIDWKSFQGGLNQDGLLELKPHS